MIKPKKSVEEMEGYFVPMYEKSWDIKIDSNENNYGPSKKVLEALKNFDYKDISFYPFYGELSQKIADYQGFSIDNIKVTNGADEAIQAIINTYLESKEILLTLDNSFDMPIVYTNIQGGKIIKVPFKKKWEFPIESFLKKLDNKKVKVIYLASPNNPTGNLIKEEDLVQILQKAQNKVVLIDETYANYSLTTYKKYVNKYDNVFVVRSFSKDFALAGMRLGYIISNEENIKNLKKVVSPFSVNAFAMKAGIAALCDLEHFNKIQKEVTESKEELTKFFTKLGAKVYPSSANFLLVNFKDKAEFVYAKLRKENISVKLYKIGHKLENHLRITIPTKQGVEKIEQVLKVKPYLVFDMDGVLVDAQNSYRATIEKTYEKFTGKKVSQKEIQAAKNSGGLNNDWDLTKYLLEKAGKKVCYHEIVDVFQEIYWNNGKGLINNETSLFNKDILVELSKDYNLAIYTGRPRPEAMYALKRFEAQNLFFPILTCDDIPHGMGKPNPLGLNLIKQITIGKSYTYFGDTKDDIIAAECAGYKAIGVLPPQDKTKELKESLKNEGAKATLNTINDIKTILE